MSDTVSVGAEIIVTSAVADEVRQRLRDAVDEIVSDFEDEVIDYGRD